MVDYSVLDQPSLLQYIFYPRKDQAPCPEDAFDLSVPVDTRISVSCRFYPAHPRGPWILFFHGNGEVASDYDGTAGLYHQRGMNLVVADYRGYGASNGIPTLTHLAQDSLTTFQEVKRELAGRHFRDDLWVMGRSLGSVAALEIAFQYQETLNGFIIESGSMCIVRVMRHLMISLQGARLEKIERECLQMVQGIVLPALIIHGQQDSLIPLKEAEDLYRYLGSDKKQLIVISSADHNDLMFVGLQRYFESLQQFIERTDRSRATD